MPKENLVFMNQMSNKDLAHEISSSNKLFLTAHNDKRNEYKKKSYE
jgi:hypothetical protein